MFISSALAATAEHAAEHAADAAHHGPWFVQAENWVAISFFIVFAFAAPKIYRAVVAALDLRREKIKARIEEAQRLREEAQELLAAYQRKQRDALKEAEEIVAHAKAEAQRLADQAARDLEAALARREQQALDRIAQAEAQALKEVRNVAVDVAINATRRLIADTLPQAQAEALIDKSINDLPAKLH